MANWFERLVAAIDHEYDRRIRQASPLDSAASAHPAADQADERQIMHGPPSTVRITPPLAEE